MPLLNASHQKTKSSAERSEASPGVAPPLPALFVRCPQCGHRVLTPCSVCRIRELTTGGPQTADRVAACTTERPLRIELQGAQRARYEQLYARKRRRGRRHRRRISDTRMKGADHDP
jgi:predicted RNA-binding Zn-ribbon protein involved in translation (DUF1610 family)